MSTPSGAVPTFLLCSALASGTCAVPLKLPLPAARCGIRELRYLFWPRVVSRGSRLRRKFRPQRFSPTIGMVRTFYVSRSALMGAVRVSPIRTSAGLPVADRGSTIGQLATMLLEGLKNFHQLCCQNNGRVSLKQCGDQQISAVRFILVWLHEKNCQARIGLILIRSEAISTAASYTPLIPD